MRLLLLCIAVIALRAEGPLDTIRASQEGWNSGKIERYMECYEKSDDTTFVGRTVTKGWASVLQRYQKAYPDAASMGKLQFTELEERFITPEIAIATGRYTLNRQESSGGTKTGLFSVVMRKRAGGWRIIHDHSN